MKRTRRFATPFALASPPRRCQGPRMLRIRADKPLHEADSLATLRQLMAAS